MKAYGHNEVDGVGAEKLGKCWSVVANGIEQLILVCREKEREGEGMGCERRKCDKSSQRRKAYENLM